MFDQASAASVAASRTVAPPVSVRRKFRSGVSRFRAQAVRPENGCCGSPLLLVALDDVGPSRVGVARIAPGITQRPPLAQEVPVLVESDLQLLQALTVGIAGVARGLPF